ncbi:MULTISPECIES: cation:proton antiporter [unclassified Streptomyces]|uniref:cation:proton antiporter n=1 Tax=unclassified Streptomyces TaxID=2593676 RepID=UPI002DD8FB6A|nr:MULTISPECIES: cation:proton antiporter [unclassified Streptomyces]WSC44151.1 cation:proton antiporter [Streptomyces sp. NBC_01762]WSD23738.1 cation:proton antiporter [Streptomyces sp. NBC_01751]WSF87744.1 cation:proton antiporter [Streptomyces sp. NBC_01744]
MTADQVLMGVGLTLVLAVGSQILAGRLRIPALIVLLPVGFAAGAVVDELDPRRLLGPAFSPLVSLAVAVILYDAGLGLDLRKLKGHTRRVVIRLIWIGVLITWVLGTLLAMPLLGMDRRAAVMLGAILVVSGPTVVGPLLSFVRPKERPQHILVWEGSLIDPVGGILGALVFHLVEASTGRHVGSGALNFLGSVGVGTAGGIVGTALLWVLFRRLLPGEILGTTAQLAAVIAVAAFCDVVREDSGLIAAVMMGLAVANLPRFDVPARRPFFETLVSLILGLLFISISATVTPQSLRHVVLPALGLTVVLVLVVRPLVAIVSTLGTDLTRGERGFIGWMAPRGIVAAATASTFSATLVAKGIGGASKILPTTFVVIVATVTLYGLTASAVARRLGVVRPSRSRPLLVGGEPWVVDLGRALSAAGLQVLMWAGLEQQRERIGQAGLELAPGELLAAATGEGAELEGITAVFFLTAEDDFNALAATVLRGSVEGSVHRVGSPRESVGVVAPFIGGEVLFGTELTGVALTRRYEDGASIVTRPADQAAPAGWDMLFLVRGDGRLDPVTEATRPLPGPGDLAVLLAPADHPAVPPAPGRS